MFGVLQTPSVLVLGLGESGLAMARWSARFGCAVAVADTRLAPSNLDALKQAIPQAKFVGGDFTPELLNNIQLLAISPGLSLLEPSVASLLESAKERNIPLWGEIEFFAQALSHLKETSAYAPKLIAITGTNGKTTTTSLVGKLCLQAGKTVAVAGNISPAALDKLAECIEQVSLPDIWVLELSSFQLETTYSLNADAATVLNITQDHLDWHGDMPAYIAAKAKIFGTHSVQVLNRQDPIVMGMAKSDHKQISFGTDMPNTMDGLGIWRENGLDWIVQAEAEVSDAPVKKLRKGEVAPPPNLVFKRLMPLDALQIRGLHNASNAMAALALTEAIGLPLNQLLHGLRNYQGEPHRVQLIGIYEGIEFYDDSKGTNVGATVAAISGLSKPIILIAGGDGKGQDFSPLEAPVKNYARKVFLIGKDADRLTETLRQTGVPLQRCSSLEEATREAAAAAQSGDAVLLSPACASLDMFRNYAHRAEVFVATVNEWVADQGGML